MTEEEMKKRIEALEADLAKTAEDKKAALGEKFKLATDLKAAQKAAEEAAENATTATSTELEKAIKRAEKAEKLAKDADDRAASLQKTMRDANADSAISKLIASANVDAADAKLLTRALRASVDFGEDGSPVIDGQSVEDYGKDFFGQKGEGYRYVRAANNTGGGARGTDGTKPATMTKENFNLTEYGKLRAGDPVAADAIKTQLGLSY